MNAIFGRKTIFCTLIAAGLTLFAVWVDQYRAKRYELDAALRWARQLFAQVESMEFSARERGEKDSLDWAVNFLAQGTEPRLSRVHRFIPTDIQRRSGNTEFYFLNRSTGTFDYSHLTQSDRLAGVKISLDLSGAGILQGFLGTHSLLTEDATIATLFILLFLFTRKVVFHSKRRKEMNDMPKMMEELTSRVPPTEAPQPVTVATPEIKTSVNALGVEIRDLVKQAHSMVLASRNSQLATHGLKDRINASLNQLHSNRKQLKEATQLIAQAENLADNPLDPLNQKQLLVLLEKLKELSVRNERVFRDLEIQIEPCLIDADLASEAYSSAAVATEKMDEHIQKTKEKLVSHVRAIQSKPKSPAA